jgi:hypothetical protein
LLRDRYAAAQASITDPSLQPTPKPLDAKPRAYLPDSRQSTYLKKTPKK